MEQFEGAMEKEQKPFEALGMLGFCYWEKGVEDEAQYSFEKALGIENISQERILSAKYILSLLSQERGQIEDALRLSMKLRRWTKASYRCQRRSPSL